MLVCDEFSEAFADQFRSSLHSKAAEPRRKRRRAGRLGRRAQRQVALFCGMHPHGDLLFSRVGFFRPGHRAQFSPTRMVFVCLFTLRASYGFRILNNMTTTEDAFGFSIISCYSRAEALADGALVDVSTLGRQAGFRVPVAVTQAVWLDCIEWSEEDSERVGVPQDQDGRLWDVLWLAWNAARRAGDGDRSTFKVCRVDRASKEGSSSDVTLCLCIGPGDEGEPVITIMMPDED